MRTTSAPTANLFTRLTGYTGSLARRATCLLVAAAFCSAQALPAVGYGASPSEQAASIASAISLLPVFSVVAVAQKGVEAVGTLSHNGARFVVKGIEASADGVVYVLEGVSDGTRVSLKASAHTEVLASLAVGAVVAFSATEAGLVVSVAGVAVALVLNDVGKKLLYSKQVTQ